MASRCVPMFPSSPARSAFSKLSERTAHTQLDKHDIHIIRQMLCKAVRKVIASRRPLRAVDKAIHAQLFAREAHCPTDGPLDLCRVKIELALECRYIGQRHRVGPFGVLGLVLGGPCERLGDLWVFGREAGVEVVKYEAVHVGESVVVGVWVRAIGVAISDAMSSAHCLLVVDVWLYGGELPVGLARLSCRLACHSCAIAFQGIAAYRHEPHYAISRARDGEDTCRHVTADKYNVDDLRWQRSRPRPLC